MKLLDIEELIERFLGYLNVNTPSKYTIPDAKEVLNDLVKYCHKHSIEFYYNTHSKESEEIQLLTEIRDILKNIDGRQKEFVDEGGDSDVKDMGNE